MFRYLLMAVLVSLVGGCVTAEQGALYSQSSKPRSVQGQQAAKTSTNTARSAAIKRPAIILGAAY